VSKLFQQPPKTLLIPALTWKFRAVYPWSRHKFLIKILRAHLSSQTGNCVMLKGVKEYLYCTYALNYRSEMWLNYCLTVFCRLFNMIQLLFDSHSTVIRVNDIVLQLQRHRCIFDVTPTFITTMMSKKPSKFHADGFHCVHHPLIIWWLLEKWNEHFSFLSRGQIAV